MKRIGLVGENPNDTTAIKVLLQKKVGGNVEFFDLLRNVNGSLLDNPKLSNRFRKEYEFEKAESGIDLVIFIRDLDFLESNTKEKRRLQLKFNKRNKTIDKKGILLLNIVELEALIWADIEAYNVHTGRNIPPFPDPMLIEDPKGELRKHGPYNEGQTREIFPKLRIDIVAQNCRYFREFLQVFEQRLA
jgi:hypothetical protein